MYANVKNKIVVPIMKRMEIGMNIQVCLITQININYKENDGKKYFLPNPKHQYHVSKQEEHNYSADNKKNVDYCEYPSLTHFMNEH